MIDPQTGRFCIVCSYSAAHDYWQNDALALEGLPHLCDIQNRPLTDQLCTGHAAWFGTRLKYLGTCDDRGIADTYHNGVPQEICVGEETRPQHFAIGVYSQDDILNLLQYMERRLYTLYLEVQIGGQIWHHPGDTGEPAIAYLTADEVVERAGWRRWIRDCLPEFLKQERNRKPDGDDDLDDAQIRDFYAHHPIDFDNRFGSEE